MGTYDKKLYKILGERIRAEREKRKLSLEYVADKIGKTKKTMSRYELGEHRIDVDTIMDICNTLGIEYSKLNKEVEEELYQKTTNSQWGDDAANKEYLADKPELLEIYNDIVNRDDIYVLFDKVKELDPKDVESVLMFIKTIRKERGIDD